jgi:hypothetical protein
MSAAPFMRRRVLLAGCLLMLASCAQKGTLSPDQVLSSASHAAQELKSVRFSAHGTLKGASPVGSDADVAFTAQGWTQQERKQLQTGFTAEGTSGGKPLSVAADVIVAGEDDTYVNVRTITSSDPTSALRSPFFNLITNQWWRLPAADKKSAASVTPDPRLLQLQTQAVHVTKNHGMVEVDGKLSYHYDLAIDQEKLLDYLRQVAQERKETFDEADWRKTFESLKMDGSAWIDADSFELNRMQWNIHSSDAQKPLDLVFDVSFSDHNAAPVIAPPTGAKDLPSLPDLLPSSVLTPPEALAPDGMPPEMQKQLLESLLKNTH